MEAPGAVLRVAGHEAFERGARFIEQDLDTEAAGAHGDDGGQAVRRLGRQAGGDELVGGRDPPGCLRVCDRPDSLLVLDEFLGRWLECGSRFAFRGLMSPATAQRHCEGAGADADRSQTKRYGCQRDARLVSSRGLSEVWCLDDGGRRRLSDRGWRGRRWRGRGRWGRFGRFLAWRRRHYRGCGRVGGRFLGFGHGGVLGHRWE